LILIWRLEHAAHFCNITLCNPFQNCWIKTHFQNECYLSSIGDGIKLTIDSQHKRMERIKYAYAQIFEYVYATWTCIKAWNFCAPNFKWGWQTSTAKCCMRHPKFVEAENPFIIWLLSVCGCLFSPFLYDWKSNERHLMCDIYMTKTSGRWEK